MKKRFAAIVLSPLLCLMLAGCGGSQSTESSQPQAAQPAAAPTSQPTAAATPAEPAKASAAAPAVSTPAPDTAKKAAPQDVAILRGAPFGPVKFEHKRHVERAANKCETCHHPSRKEMPSTTGQQSCLDCHTKPTMEGMKTGLPAAFHDAKAQAGACIDCHVKQNAQGKKAPTKCLDCHKKENA